MTTRSRFWLGLLVGAALGVTWGVLRLRSNDAAKQKPGANELPVNSENAMGAESSVGQLVPTPGDPAAPGPRTANETQRPHPITPHHEAMAKRRELIEAVRSALQDQQYDRARSLLSESEEPGQVDREDLTFDGAMRGYRLILNCLTARAASADGSQELPPALLADSRKYLDEQRLPPRRDVRRVCLEGRPFARRA